MCLQAVVWQDTAWGNLIFALPVLIYTVCPPARTISCVQPSLGGPGLCILTHSSQGCADPACPSSAWSYRTARPLLHVSEGAASLHSWTIHCAAGRDPAIMERVTRLQKSRLNNNMTPELKKIFTEDSDSESECFEGFTQSDVDVKSKVVPGVGEEDSDDAPQPGSEEECSPPKRRRFGLRVALQFPNRKVVGKPKQSTNAPPVKPGKQNFKKTPTKGKRVQRTNKRKVGPESDSEDEGAKCNQENSNALLKRAMNIKENKAVLAQLLAELNSMPELFPVKTPATTPSKPKKTPRRSFTEGQVERRTNPTRNARPPENFALENFTASAVQFAEHLQNYGKRAMLKRTLSEEDREEYQRKRRSSKYSSFRSVEDITEEELENVAVTVKDKIYDKIVGSTCHQCRQKTVDTKTVCRNLGCGGVRGQFCGPCLRNRYGEDVRTALLDPDWICPPCREICNCSYCRKRDGRCATGMLIHLAKFYGYDNVKEYLESLQKQLVEDE